MPAPAFSWTSYVVRVRAESPLRGLAVPAAGAPAEVLTIELPDLTPWPEPAGKARILLESAAEVEHALMVQYLYAAYSLKGAGDVEEPARKAALDETSPASWPQVLLGIAREEMGHLMTVQNLLLLLGLPPNLEREDFPPQKNLYPFSLHLEPISRLSLAKYVVAEAPGDAEGIEDIRELARESAGGAINRVGVLYGLLGLVFAREEDVPAGGSGSADWDRILRELAQAAYEQAPPDAWHLPDDAFRPGSTALQADPEDWEVGDLRVHRVGDRAAAAQAIRDVGEQGEGPTTAGERSHFQRFLAVYRGGDGLPPFPAGEWAPARSVPTDPKVDADFSDLRTRRWAQIADIRYALLLGFVEHYLRITGGERAILTGWIVAEMRSRLAYMARQLATMPRGGGGPSSVAAVPFTLPAVLHLPDGDAERWALHEERTRAAIAKLEEMRQGDATDDADPFLEALLDSDRARLAFIESRPAPETTTSFARDILPLFRAKDVQHMTRLGVDLSSYDVVREMAQTIARRVGAGARPMPPAPDQRWTTGQVELFERWISEGFPQ